VGYYVDHGVGVSVNCEIESPASVHPTLPDTPLLVEFLGSQRRVPDIVRKKLNLLVASFPDLQRGLYIAAQKASRIYDLQLLPPVGASLGERNANAVSPEKIDLGGLLLNGLM
jgi:hypothetical protein